MTPKQTWYTKTRQRGFLNLLWLFILFALVVTYLNIDVRGIVDSPEVQQGGSEVKKISKTIWQALKSILMPIWENYLSKPVLYFWNNIFIDFIWEGFKNIQSKTP